MMDGFINPFLPRFLLAIVFFIAIGNKLEKAFPKENKGLVALALASCALLVALRLQRPDPHDKRNIR